MLQTTSQWWLLVLCWLLASTSNHAEGYFSASNLGGIAILGEDGVTPLSKSVGRVEILDEATVIAVGSFCKDGFFSLGIVHAFYPGNPKVITINIWDSSVGSYYAAAYAARHGYATIKLTVNLSDDINPPASLASYGFRLNLLGRPLSRPDPIPTFPIGEPQLERPYPIVDRSGEIPQSLAFQFLTPVPGGPSIFDNYTSGLNWIQGKVDWEWEANAVLRIWDPSTGSNYEGANVRGVGLVPLTAEYGNRWVRTWIRTNPLTHIKLIRSNTPAAGTFQAPDSVVRVFDIDGNPMAKERCQVEILAGTRLLSSFPLPNDGSFPLPATPISGTLPLDGTTVTIRAWDLSSGPTFNEADLTGVFKSQIQLGGDNLPAAQLWTNVIRIQLSLPAVPEVAARARRAISSAPKAKQSLSITASGEHLHYQWQFAGLDGVWADLPEGPAFIGIQTPTLELPSVTLEQAGAYRAVVSNRGGSTATSPIELFVRDTQSIRLTTTPSFQFGSETVVQPVADNTLPISMTVISGPAVAAPLPDGRTRIQPTAAGNLVLRAIQSGHSPYAAVFTDFTFPIEKAPQSIAFSGLANAFESDTSIVLDATSSSGLPVSFETIIGPGRIANGHTLQLLGPGVVTFTATQSGDANYDAVSITRSIQIVDGPQSVRLAESGPGFQLLFRGDVGRLHVVESSPTLSGVWLEVARPQASGLDRDTPVVLPLAADSARFYRVRLK